MEGSLPPWPQSTSHREAIQHILLANRLLAAGYVSQALASYTLVLYHKQPGHPCALLNRSLAYLRSGYPDLAAADCYRAAQICAEARHLIVTAIRSEDGSEEVRPPSSDTLSPHKIPSSSGGGSSGSSGKNTSNSSSGSGSSSRKRESRTKTRRHWTRGPRSRGEEELHALLTGVEAYMEAERGCVRASESWTRSTACFTGEGWLLTELASLVLSRTEERLDRSVVEDVEVRAVYRLAGALWRCGKGAVMDALGLVADVETWERRGEVNATREGLVTDAWALTNDDLLQFQDLGHELLRECVSRHEWAPERNEAYSRSKATAVERVVYPWNKAHPDLRREDVGEEASDFLNTVASKCALRYAERGEGQPFELQLVADQPVEPGETVLNEPTNLSAVIANYRELSCCENCGAAMVAVEWGDDAKSTSSKYTEETDVVMYDEDLNVIFPEVNTQLDSAAGEGDQDAELDFRECPECPADYCSAKCRATSREYHRLLCQEALHQRIHERFFVNSRLGPEAAEHLGADHVSAKEYYLYHRLLAKILAMARVRNTSPLEIDEVRWLNGGLVAAAPDVTSARRKSDLLAPSHRTLPWSFDNNIVLPAHILQQIGVRPWEHLDKFDGWVVNTLFAKIMHSTEITRGVPRQLKAYDRRYRLYPRAETVSLHHQFPELWIATIHPIASLVKTAEVGCTGNAIIEEDDSVTCTVTKGCATNSDGGGIPPGAAIVRSSDAKSVACESVSSWLGEVQLDSADTTLTPEMEVADKEDDTMKNDENYDRRVEDECGLIGATIPSAKGQEQGTNAPRVKNCTQN